MEWPLQGGNRGNSRTGASSWLAGPGAHLGVLGGNGQGQRPGRKGRTAVAGLAAVSSWSQRGSHIKGESYRRTKRGWWSRGMPRM